MVYWWLNERSLFTVEELKQTWEMLSVDDQVSISVVLTPGDWNIFIDYLSNDAPECKSDLTFCLLQSPGVTIKAIYSYLVEMNYHEPTKVWERWIQDLDDFDIVEAWPLLCKKVSGLYETKLKAFFVQFLHLIC